MDDIIRDAANQHHPAYDDKAWSRMENLLDKHLPQKKDKRKYIFFILFLLLGTGAFYAYFNTNKKGTIKTITASQDVIQPNNIPASTTDIVSQTNTTQKNTTTPDNNSAGQTTTSATINKKINKTIAGHIAANNKTDNEIHAEPAHNKIAYKTKSKFKSNISNAGIADDDTNTEQATKQNETAEEVVSDNKPTIEATTIKPNAPVITNSNTIVAAVADSSHKINDTSGQPTIAVAKKAADKKNGHGFGNNFSFTVSAGPGLSYVGLDYLGKTTFTYGAGIAYAVSKKFTVRTGFYVSSKIYSANPSDYHPPKTFWAYYPNLQKINANCKVYEVPVSLTYNFAQTKKHNWFAAAGLASYIMKDENYGYYSETPNGQTQYMNADIKNQNKNIFSILTISGGYQYHINKRFSVMAEPYLELPLNGIGFGKINLNSSGLLFTVVVKPFTH